MRRYEDSELEGDEEGEEEEEEEEEEEDEEGEEEVAEEGKCFLYIPSRSTLTAPSSSSQET